VLILAVSLDLLATLTVFGWSLGSQLVLSDQRGRLKSTKRCFLPLGHSDCLRMVFGEPVGLE
jgi:hypothetical protein